MTTAFTNVLQIIAKRLFFILLLSFEGIQTEEIYSIANDGANLSSALKPTKGNFLNGRHLLFAAVEAAPFVVIQRSANETTFKGFCLEIIDTLKSFYNFTYTVIEPPDGAFGALSNGNWSGIVKLVKDRECDAGISHFSMTYDRYQAVDFTVGFYEEPTAILIPPPTQQTRLFDCARPFSWQVWIGLISCVILFPHILWVSFRIAHFNVLNKKRPGLREAHLFVCGVLFTQSGLAPRLGGHNPTLILISLWCLIVIVFIYAYIGILISFLTVPTFKPIISSLDDLPTSSLQWIARKGSAEGSLFMDAKEGIYKVIGDGLRRFPENFASDVEYGPKKVLNGSFAYFLGKSPGEFLIFREYKQTGKCRLSLAKQEFYKFNKGFILQKNSQLKAMFDKKLIQMIEGGLTEYWRRRIWPMVKQCDHAHQSHEPRSLKLDDIQSPLLIWGIGMCLALTAFSVEHLYFLLLTSKQKLNVQFLYFRTIK